MSEEIGIIVVDDDPAMRHMLSLMLNRAGYEVCEAKDGEEALCLLREDPCEIALCDIRMPGLGGLGFLREVHRSFPGLTVIMMTAYGSIDLALKCMSLGAYDYIAKPFKTDEVVLTLKKAEERLGLRRENMRLRQALTLDRAARSIVYSSGAMERVMQMVERLAVSNSPVLVTGETGTGKELIAQELHRRSDRGQGPFFSLNCGAIPAGLIESELFGHVRGAFTGAEKEREGLFLAADGGTLFLDEIAELPLDLQPKLLRVLQEKEVRRIGENRHRKVDTRVIAATAVDMRQAVEEGRFRDDLYYRLNVLEIFLPPLRERTDDIPPLVEHFLKKFARSQGRPAPSLSEECLSVLERYDWPGNVRELGNFIERTMIFCREKQITLGDLPWELRRDHRTEPVDLSLKKATSRIEKDFIQRALSRTHGNRTHAARLLEISLRSLLYKIKEYGIE